MDETEEKRIEYEAHRRKKTKRGKLKKMTKKILPAADYVTANPI
jgi:hypothetical protein